MTSYVIPMFVSNNACRATLGDFLLKRLSAAANKSGLNVQIIRSFPQDANTQKQTTRQIFSITFIAKRELAEANLFEVFGENEI